MPLQSAYRKAKNAAEAKERWAKYERLRESTEPFVFPEIPHKQPREQ
jgi:hypothetical protein